MRDTRTVPPGGMYRVDDTPGTRAREAGVDGVRWTVVEYEEGVGREKRHEDGHRRVVIPGRMEYDFDGAPPPLRSSEGEALLLPGARLGEGTHRGRNLVCGATRLSPIDDSAEG